MNRFSIIACIGGVMSTAASAMAQDFNIDWNTIDNGGGRSTGGAIALTGTIGQHDASGPMTGGSFSLTGGFWYPGDVVPVVCAADLFPVNEDCGQGDGVVGPADLAQLLSNWGSCPDCCADLFPTNGGDNIVGPGDLASLLAVWGQCK